MRIQRGIFSTPTKAWTAVAVYTGILYSTLTVAFDLYVSVYDRMGRAVVSSWMNRAFLAAGLLLLLVVIRVAPRKLSGYVAFLLIGLAVAFCLQYLTIPAKRFHFFQYAPLTVLVFDALRFRCQDQSIYVWTLSTVFLIGLGDETIQGLLPDRYFGVVDLAINTAAGALTLAFIGFVWREENYPWPR